MTEDCGAGLGASVGGTAVGADDGAAVAGTGVAVGALTGAVVAAGGSGVGDGGVWLAAAAGAGACVATAASGVGVLVGVGVNGGADWQPLSRRADASKRSSSPTLGETLIVLGTKLEALRRRAGREFDMVGEECQVSGIKCQVSSVKCQERSTCNLQPATYFGMFFTAS